MSLFPPTGAQQQYVKEHEVVVVVIITIVIIIIIIKIPPQKCSRSPTTQKRGLKATPAEWHALIRM